jgi:enoyl-CoA hydratase/carnithine racemase
MENEILFSRHERNGSAYAEILLNRPAKGNALTLAMLDQLEEVANRLAKDREIRVVVIRGAGRFFCTGGDIGEWSALSPQQMAAEWILRGISVFQAIASLPQPVIAALHGHTLGGGLELALAADLRLAMQTTKFGNPEVTLGMVAGWTGVRRLAETIGVSRARHLTLLGSAISAQQALAWGLITELAETPEAFEAALQVWLDRLLANGPVAMALTKGLLSGMHADLRHHHAAAAAQAAATEDCAEGVRAFVEKRIPIFHNR